MQTRYDSIKRRWRVSYQANGKQHRRFFATEAEARAFKVERKADVQTFGVAWHSLTALERGDVLVQLDRLRRAGWTLRAAVDFVLERGKAPPCVSLAEACRQFITAKEAAGRRPRTVRALRLTLRLFCAGRAENPLAEITASDIDEFLNRNGWQPRTRLGYLIDLRTFFSFAVKRGFCRENTAQAVETPIIEDKPPEILGVTQCRALMEACQRFEPALVPTLAACLFAGLRPEEARRVAWEDVRADFLEVKAHKAKTRRRRLIPLSPQLRAWLEWGRRHHAPLPVTSHAKRFNRLRRLVGLFDGWPQNALRHSFASYHFAAHRNENETAFIMGNSPQMVFGHYREIVERADAEAFFAILPGDVEPNPTEPKPGSRGAPLVTAALLRELFHDGARGPTPRRALVSELCARGISETTAYAALRAGSYASDLLAEDENGLLSLAPVVGTDAAISAAVTAPAPTAPT